jgi:hypothetical protein
VTEDNYGAIPLTDAEDRPLATIEWKGLLREGEVRIALAPRLTPEEKADVNGRIGRVLEILAGAPAEELTIGEDLTAPLHGSFSGLLTALRRWGGAYGLEVDEGELDFPEDPEAGEAPPVTGDMNQVYYADVEAAALAAARDLYWEQHPEDRHEG